MSVHYLHVESGLGIQVRIVFKMTQRCSYQGQGGLDFMGYVSEEIKLLLMQVHLHLVGLLFALSDLVSSDIDDGHGHQSKYEYKIYRICRDRSQRVRIYPYSKRIQIRIIGS